jgi:hypothetical protein
MRQISRKQLELILGILVLSIAYVFREKIVDAYTGRVCMAALDITAILDSSSSIEKSNWDKYVVSSMHLFGDKFNLAPNETRIGITTFSANTIVHMALDSKEATSNKGFTAALKRLEKSYRGGDTNPLPAFLDIERKQLSLHSSRSGIPYIITFFTDGDINNKSDEEETIKSVARIKQNKDVHLVCVAIGPNIKTDYLTKLCDNDNIYKVGYFSNLADAISAMAKRICTIPPTTKTKQDNCMCVMTERGCYLLFPAGMLFGAALTVILNQRMPGLNLNQGAIAATPTFLSFSQTLQQAKRRVVDTVANVPSNVPAMLERNRLWCLDALGQRQNPNGADTAWERNKEWCKEKINGLPDRSTLYAGVKRKLHLA